MPSYCYLKDIGNMKTIKVEKVEILNPKQILVKHDEFYSIVSESQLISIERYHDIKKKEMRRRKNYIEDWINSEGITLADMYDILQKIDDETNN